MSKSVSIPRRVWDFFSGFGLATFLLVTLGVLTWLATLEMVEHGLLMTLRKYFDWRSWYVLGELKLPGFERPLVIPLPGGWWVCALLVVNMILGGLIRARKGVRSAGALIAHFGIVFMIVAGGVAQFAEQRGVMMLVEGQQADFAISLTEPTIEVMEISDGEVQGEVSVVREQELDGLAAGDQRMVKIPGRPFDLEISGWMRNAVVRPEGDGWALDERERNLESEMDSPGTFARVVWPDGSKGEPFILAVPPVTSGLDAYQPMKVEADGKTYAVRLVKQTIPVPFHIKLKDAVSEYYPNSFRPKSFLSDIERIDSDGEPVPVRISMNEPLRSGGYTFFQRTMSGGPTERTGPEFSGFEVVSNPADQWPTYSLYIVTFGLLLQFGIKFANYMSGPGRPRKEI